VILRDDEYTGTRSGQVLKNKAASVLPETHSQRDLNASIDVIWPGPERQTSRVESIAVDQCTELVDPL